MKKVIACILTVAMIFGLVCSPAVSHAYAEDETVHEGHVHSAGTGGGLITHETCDHVFGEWVITLEPTCTEVGEKTRTCSKCGAIETEEIEALDHDYIGVVTDPTCTEPGYTVYTCSRCGDTYTDDYETERGHIWNAWTETTPPTCTEEGVETRTCRRCGETDTRAIEALGHDYIGVVTDPTCTEMGYTTYTCSRCGDSYTDDYETERGHIWTAWTVITAVTCTEDGAERRSCRLCGETEDRVVEAPGHDWSDWTVITPATCTEDGYGTRTCNRCGLTESGAIEAPGHDWSEWTFTKPVTCTEAGEKTRSCSRCNEAETVVVDALGHDYIGVETSPTCTEPGYTTYTCSRCGKSYVDDYVTERGHNWGEWTVATAATCTEDGVETRKCSRCDDTETRTIAALGHDIVHYAAKAPTCTEIGWKAYDACSRHDYTTYEEIPALGHDFDEWQVTKGPSCTEAGEEIRNCSRCNETEKRVISALGHNLVHHDAKAPTCTNIGWDAYDTCSRCNYSTYTELSALGHDWGDWTVAIAATCEENGQEKRVCKNDPSHVLTRSIAATGHTPGATVIENEVEPTCAAEGGYDEVVYCTTCGKELSRAHTSIPALLYATYNGASLSLKDKISINVYMIVPDEAEGWQAKVYYEKDNFETVKYTFDLNKSSKAYVSKTDEYKIVYSDISAKELTENVRIIIFDGDGNPVMIQMDDSFVEYFDYCAADWANTMINDPARPAKTVNLAKSLLNYGGEAQKYWDYKPQSNANAAGHFAAEMAAVTVDNLAPYAPVKDANASAVGSNGISLSLKSETYLNAYFTKEVTVTATNLNGAKVAVSKSGKEWVVKITGITAKNLGNQYTLTIKNGSTTSTQKYSALSWAYNILNGTSEKAKPLAKALYLYQQAAKAYYGS